MPLLTREGFLGTFGETRKRAGNEDEPPFNYWPYFDAIPAEDFDGHDCSAGIVRYAWRMSPGPYEHVLVCSEDPNVFMVLVLDVENRTVYGHRLWPSSSGSQPRIWKRVEGERMRRGRKSEQGW